MYDDTREKKKKKKKDSQMLWQLFDNISNLNTGYNWGCCKWSPSSDPRRAENGLQARPTLIYHLMKYLIP